MAGAGIPGAEAIREFQRVVKLDPRSAWTHDLLGQALLQLDRTAEAKKAFMAALDVQPDFSPARLNLAATMLKQGESVGAIGQLREVLRLIRKTSAPVSCWKQPPVKRKPIAILESVLTPLPRMPSADINGLECGNICRKTQEDSRSAQ